MKRKDHSRTPAPAGPFNAAFAKLKSLAAELPPGPEAASVSPEAPPANVLTSDASSATPARAVIRLERKGHGGKEVTVVSHLELSDEALGAWLSELKATLGVGGRRDDETLVLQGDQRERLRDLLSRRGVKRITVS